MEISGNQNVRMAAISVTGHAVMNSDNEDNSDWDQLHDGADSAAGPPNTAQQHLAVADDPARKDTLINHEPCAINKVHET